MPETNPQHRVPEPVPTMLKSICHLSVRRRKGLWGTINNSSGVLFRERYVLTAAHNVYSTLLSGVKTITASLGKVNVDDRDTIAVRQWRVASGYGWRNFARDFAVLRLPDPVVVSQPYYLAPVQSSADVEGPLHIAGYPGQSGGERNGRTLFSGIGRATYTSGSPMLDYDIDTETGNSGGPVWIAGADGLPRVVGVHVTELGGTHGRARIADAEFAEEVERMIASLG